MQNEELKILYEDDEMVAINKPSGLLVHRTKLDRYEKKYAIQTLRNQIGSWVYPIHRLDKGTSGVLLFGKNSPAASKLGELVLNKGYTKQYYALVRGFPPNVMRINYPVPQGNRMERKAAATQYSCLSRTEIQNSVGIFDTARYSLLNVIPETGRRHQIRRHLKHVFYPIIGDRRYGDRAHNKFFREELELVQMFLHAKSLQFTSPFNSKEIILNAEFPEHWQKLFDYMPELSD